MGLKPNPLDLSSFSALTLYLNQSINLSIHCRVVRRSDRERRTLYCCRVTFTHTRDSARNLNYSFICCFIAVLRYNLYNVGPVISVGESHQGFLFD